jgi:Protein of unknown function (DUF2868)
MATRTDRFTLHELVLTEAVKDLEAGTPLQDSTAMADAARATTDRAARHVRRALQLAAATGLDVELYRLRRRAVALGVAVAAVGVACAALLALSMLGEGRRINALAAMALLIVPNAIGIVLWALLLIGGGRGGAGWLAGAAAWLARQRWAQGGVQRVLPAALRLLDAQRLTPWVLGGLNHLLWALAYGLASLLLAAVLAFSAYRLGWETTILSPQTLQEIARTLAWLPAALGLPAQVPADAEAPGASQALGWWLISGTLVYGALPRLLLLALCGVVTLSRSRALPLDLQDPYHRRLISRFEALAPTQVIDSERAVPERHHDAAAAAADAGALAVIGFELPPELSAPAPLLAQAAWTQRIDGGSDERQALLQRLAATPPARLIVVCHAPSTPDRGTLRFLDGLRAGAIALLLAPPAQADTGAARWRDWLAEAGRSDLPVFTDAEAALRWRGAAHG